MDYASGEVMLTLFAIPKAFEGESLPLQRNALRSWSSLPGTEILLLGDDAGVGEAAAEFGLRHVPGVAVNELGTPLLDSAFALAEEHARYPIMAYTNADLVFGCDFMDAISIAAARDRQFMLVGRCYDLDVVGELDVEQLTRLQERDDGEFRGWAWIDYFVFQRRALGKLPTFAVGRPRWDNWMIWRARRLGLDLIDIGDDVRVIHQRHGYGHVKEGTGVLWWGREADANTAFLRSEQLLSIEDATHRLIDGQVVRKNIRFRHRVRTYLKVHDWGTPVFRVSRWVWWNGWGRYR